MANKKYKGVFRDDNGAIFYQVTLGRDLFTNKTIKRKGRKDKSGKPFKTEKAAFAELQRVKTEYNNSQSKENYNITFEEFWKEYYIPRQRSRTRPVTVENSIPVHERHILPRFGKKKLREISTSECEQFRIYLSQLAGYQLTYASFLWKQFRAIVRYAGQLRLIDFDPTKGLDAIDITRDHRQIEPKIWIPSDLQKVLNTFNLEIYHDRLYYTMIFFYWATGVRANEGCSLRWSDIDFSKNQAHVHGTVVQSEGIRGEWIVQPYTKTSAGMRIIELDETTMKVLREWRSVQIESDEDSFVFSKYGQVNKNYNLNNELKYHAELAKVERITAVGLRKSHASFLINVLQKPATYISRRMGHANPSITLKHYSFWFNPEPDSLISDEITNAFSKFNL